MCEILILAEDVTNPDPIIDIEGCLKAGDAVSLAGDGYGWGFRESKAAWIAKGNDPALWPGKFIIVKIPGEPISKAKALLDPYREIIGPDQVSVIKRQRAFGLDFSTFLPADWVAAIEAGETTVLAAIVVQRMFHKITGNGYTGFE